MPDLEFIWGFFMAYWLAIFWVWIGGILLIIAGIKFFDEVFFRIERYRYRRQLK